MLATLHIGYFHIDLAIKTSRTQQSRVQDIRTVGCRNEDHVGGGVETVHFHQQLVECLFAFVVTATHSGTALTTYCVDFVDEDDGG